MYEYLLNEKSNVKIDEQHWVFETQFSVDNQCGSLGRNDLIRRQDAVRLLGEMNLKLARIYDEAKTANPSLANELLEATSVLSYAMWGLRELESADIQSSSTYLSTELTTR